MARLTMTAAHPLTRDEAVRRVREKLSSLATEHRHRLSDLHEEWSGDRLSFGFTTVGVKITGTVVVTGSDVQLAATVPFSVMLLKGRIRKIVRAELAALLRE
jgi:hypothetical protein